jgi:hypothetical protein
VGAAKRVGADHTHSVRVDFAKSLTKSFETRQSARGDFTVETTFFIETRTKTYALAQAIDDGQLPVDITGDNHVETVGAEIDRGQQLWRSPTVPPTHVTP